MSNAPCGITCTRAGIDVQLVHQPSPARLGVHDDRVHRAQQRPACRPRAPRRTSRGSTSCAVRTTRTRERAHQPPVERRDRQPLEMHDVRARLRAGGAPGATCRADAAAPWRPRLAGRDAVEALGRAGSRVPAGPRRTGSGSSRAHVAAPPAPAPRTARGRRAACRPAGRQPSRASAGDYLGTARGDRSRHLDLHRQHRRRARTCCAAWSRCSATRRPGHSRCSCSTTPPTDGTAGGRAGAVRRPRSS